MIPHSASYGETPHGPPRDFESTKEMPRDFTIASRYSLRRAQPMRLAPGDSERYYMSAQILPTAHRLLGPAPEDWMWPREAPEALGGSGKILGDSGRYLYFPDVERYRTSVRRVMGR